MGRILSQSNAEQRDATDRFQCHAFWEQPTRLRILGTTGSGHTQALVTLKVRDVRPVGPADILAMRKVEAA